MPNKKAYSTNWGGARKGSGRPARAASTPRGYAQPLLRPTPPAPISIAMMQAAIDASREDARRRLQSIAPFKPAQHPPEATPPEGYRMAMDNVLSWADSNWSASGSYGVLSAMGAEGMLFPGYPYLSQLAQRPEYRVFSETIADDATRKGMDFEVTGNENERRREQANDRAGFEERMGDPDERKKRLKASGKTDKVKALKDDQQRLEVMHKFYEVSRDDGFFGRSHLFLNFGDAESNELKMPIGNGRDALSQGKVKRGSLNELKVIEPIWVYPMNYNATNPLLPNWYDPKTWYVMGQEVDGSRILKFIGHPVPDLLKPAYSFGGISLSQLAQPYVDIWLTTRQSVADLIRSFSIMVLKTDLQTILQPNSAAGLLTRVGMFNAMRDNQGTFVVNKNSEDFANVSAPLSGLHELQAQAQEHMAAVVRLPLVKMTGISPSGLNASSEGEIAVYDDTIAAYQNRFIRPGLAKVINFQQLSLFGEIDPELTFVFEPLRSLTDKEIAEKQKMEAERDQIHVDLAAISSAEVRQRIINDPTLPYTGLDPDELPDLKEEEEGGLEPEGGRPDPALTGSPGEEDAA